MSTRAERYFLEQLAPYLADASEVVASGYFRTFIRDRWGEDDPSIFIDADEARGFFLALTKDKLLVVKTRAPATRSPILENKGVLAIPLSSIQKVKIDTDLFLIESDRGMLSLQLQVSNKAFPSQGRLLEEIAKRFDISVSVASIRAAQRKKRLMKVGIVAAGIIAGFLLAMFKDCAP